MDYKLVINVRRTIAFNKHIASMHGVLLLSYHPKCEIKGCSAFSCEPDWPLGWTKMILITSHSIVALATMDLSAIQESLTDYKVAITGKFVLLLTFYFVSGFFTVPAHLWHSPYVPFAQNERREGVVLVWASGRWFIS